MNKCEWKDVPGYEGIYQANKNGEVRSIERVDFAGRKLKGILLKPSKTGSGYFKVDLTKESITKTTTVHRIIAKTFIAGYKTSCQIDHKDMDKTNNCLDNLRISDSSKNKANSVKIGNGTSKYKGVSKAKSKNKWQAQIKVNGKSIYLGTFREEIRAAEEYDKKALFFFGEHARTNRQLGIYPNLEPNNAP